MPKRIQRKRTKGWRMPEGAIYVGRPTSYGNPWTAGEPVNAMMAQEYGLTYPSWFGRSAGELVADAADAVAMYRQWIFDCTERGVPHDLISLRGKDLVCWCCLDRPCHADVLLELANT